MSEGIIVALISLIGVLGVPAIGWLTAAQISTRNKIKRADATNHALWEYTRILIDHIYRGGLGPPPPPPEHISHIYDARNEK